MSGISSFFDGIWNTIKSDEKNLVLPILAKAAANVAANPSEANALAQGVLAMNQIIAVQPGIGQDVLKDVAASLGNLAASVASAPAK